MSDIETAHTGDEVEILSGPYAGEFGIVLGPVEPWSYSVRITSTAEEVVLRIEQVRLAPSPDDTLVVPQETRSTMTDATNTVSSNSAAVDLGPAKAVAGGVAGTAVAFLTGLGVAIADGTVSGQEWVNIALATVIGAVAAFGITYQTPTKVTIH